MSPVACWRTQDPARMPVRPLALYLMGASLGPARETRPHSAEGYRSSLPSQGLLWGNVWLQRGPRVWTQEGQTVPSLCLFLLS